MSSCCAVRVLIVVIDRECISEKVMFYSLKTQSNPIAGHKIRDGV